MLRNHKAEFVPVETGIAGTTDIEVTWWPEGRRRDRHRELQDFADITPRERRESRQFGPEEVEEES